MRYVSRFLFAFALLVVANSPAVAQNLRKISGEATYYGEANDSPSDAKRKALEAARINALAAEFGTVLSQITVQREVSDTSGERSYFSSLAASEVKGEWIADDGEPEFKIELDANDLYVVHCKVRIVARGLSNKASDFEATVLRNGVDTRHAATNFHSGDQMYLHFRCPADGYVAVYLVLENDQVMALLPYKDTPSGKAPVRKNRDYVFFSAANADNALGSPSELLVQTDMSIEHNQLYVLYSPDEFSKAVDRDAGDGLPRVLSYAEFASWLAKIRRNDDRMGMKVFNIIITER